MLSKRYQSTLVDRRTWLHGQSVTLETITDFRVQFEMLQCILNLLTNYNHVTIFTRTRQYLHLCIETQPPFVDRKLSNTLPLIGGLQNQLEHHTGNIITKYEAMHPTVVSDNNSSSRMLIILIKVEKYV